MTLFEALTGGAFDRLNWQHSGEVDQNFSKKSNAPGFAGGGGGWRGMSGSEIDWYISPQHILCTKKLLFGGKKQWQVQQYNLLHL